MALMLLPAGAGAATQAESADSFVETVGVNTHLGYDDTPYDNFAMVRQRLNELGIRYIRDGFSLNRSPIYSRVRTLAGDGIRLNVTATDPLGRWQFGTIDQQLAMIETELLPALVSIEGPNEYDIQADPNWVAVIRDHIQRLYEGIKSRPRLASLPVVGPSIVRRENMARAGDLSAWVDYGNTHTYLSGTTPESDSVWDGEFRAASAIFGDHPWQVTETGYHNGVNGPSTGHQPASEAAAGIYMPRLFLENFRRGIVRSFSYELLDQRPDPGKTDIEANFGLLRNDFSKKPAAVALERLLGLLSDRGAGFAPQSLEYGIVGMPASGQQILLQKRDGSFYLVLWNRVSVWNTANRSDLAPADVPITVNLGQPIAGVQIYKPNVSASPIASGANPGSIELGLSAAVTIVRLTPPGGAPEPTPEPEPPKEEPKPNPEPGPQPESPSAPDSGAPPVGPIADDVVEIEEPPKTKQRAPAVPQLLEPARAETIDPVIRPAVVTSRRAPLHSPPAFCKRARARHKSRIGQTISATPQRRMQVAGQRRTSRGHIAGNCSAPRRR